VDVAQLNSTLVRTFDCPFTL